MLHNMINARTREGFGPTIQDILIPKAKTLMNTIRTTIDAMEQKNILVLDRLLANSETSARKAIMFVIIGNSVACAVLVSSASLLIRQINERKQHAIFR